VVYGCQVTMSPVPI